jgi:hypothetical protein
MRSKFNIIFALFCVLTLITCIDPYKPILKGYGSLLVVDGLLTDENISYTIKLSRTFQDQNTSPEKVTNANVTVTDDKNKTAYFNYRGNGIYKSDSLTFRAVPGSKYVLHVITQEGDEYESEQCLMQSVPDIDSVYFEKDQELANNNSENEDGIRIYINTQTGGDNLCFRWAFEETWKFRIPFPKRFDYINSNNIVPVKNYKEYCWKTRKSDDVVVHEVGSGVKGSLKGQPIYFIASAKSDRLMSEYSILVKQYSISKDEFEFWNSLKRLNESAGDIFALQPFSVLSNIRNVNNPKERILGFFQVSAIKQKRIFIPFSEVVRLRLPFYHSNECERIEKSPGEYSTQFGPPVTFDDLYAMFCITSNYSFVEPSYNEETHQMDKLVFAKPECANCELTGFPEKPVYWVDMK